jgi:hypothetical protein
MRRAGTWTSVQLDRYVLVAIKAMPAGLEHRAQLPPAITVKLIALEEPSELVTHTL